MPRILPLGPTGARSIRVLLWRPESPFPKDALARVVYQGLNYIKQARVAIMADSDAQDEIPPDLAKYLDPERNYQWSGLGRRLDTGSRRPRVLVGEYVDWFQWYMQFQRFKTFHTVILVDPVSAVSDEKIGGFVDGLIARLMTKVPQVVVVTKGRMDLLKFDETHLNGVLMALLYGTRLSRGQLVDAMARAIVPIPDQALQKALDGWHPYKSWYELSEDDEEMVQGMVPRRKYRHYGEAPEEPEQLFRRIQKREYIRPEPSWVREETLKFVKTKGWFTPQTLFEYFRERYGEFGKSEVPPPREAYPYGQREYRTAAQVFLPSFDLIRRICQGLVKEGALTTHVWYREIGRPARVYTEPGGITPFNENAKCGQCSFYIGPKHQCRIWSLVYWKYHSWGFRWAGPTPAPDDFEMYKTRNSGKIGPHSSACRLFIDKKRDHLRKEVPAACEICGMALKSARVVVCFNCGTIYSPWGRKVRVQTGYDHEYRRRYKQITGSDAELDQGKQKEEWSRLPQREWERLLPLASEPEVPSADKKPELGPWVRPTFGPSLQRRVDEKAQTTIVTKLLSQAMIKSALNATRRLSVVSRPDSNLVEEALRRQERYLSLVSEAKSGQLLTYEAHAMKEYWACYDSALKPALQWFGPRVRYRFVSEFVDEPGGRAKGYSALHAAINYLHQRRLRQAMRINAELGFEGTADGFLHRESYNSRHTGLLFDMIDPFKFADREELLAVVLNRGLTWRDFKMDSDRYNSTFYYPASSAITTLDQVGADADQIVVRYQEVESDLRDAYRRFAASLLASIESPEKPRMPEPFVYTPV